MTPIQSFLLAFFEGFVIGVLPFILLMRGFFGSYFRVRFNSGRYLLRLHMEDGVSVSWRVGIPRDNIVVYKLGKEEYVCSLVSGVSKRQWGVRVIDVPHGRGETAPFNYEKVTVEKQEESVRIVSNSGEPILDKDGEQKISKRVVPRLVHFLGWDDSRVIMVAIRTALMQPRKGTALGNIDFKKVLWILIVVGGAIYLAMTVLGNDNVI